MDRRGWLWKKKSSDKNIKVENEKPMPTSESVGPTLSSVAHAGDQVFVCFRGSGWKTFLHEVAC